MALVEFHNKQGLVITPLNSFPNEITNINATLNAVGESVAAVGKIFFPSGSGSKTISSAGGKIWFNVPGLTWATAGTTLKIGIQDVNLATGLEDGTFDVFDELVQGVDPLTTGNKEITMSTGSKTINHGDLIAVVIEMTIRNGSDSINIADRAMTSNFPYCTIDTGTHSKFNSHAPAFAIQFDDGTIGHFGDWTIPFVETFPLLASNMTPDEHALVFQIPFACTINGLFFRLGDVDAGDEATVHLIQDPFGTITNLQTATLDSALQSFTSSNTGGHTMVEIPETSILANTEYAVAYRATTTGTRNIKFLTFPHAELRKALTFQFTGATRTDLGSFTPSTVAMPDFGFRINKIDVGTGGTGERSVAYV